MTNPRREDELFTEITIPVERTRSLVFAGDVLVDWVAGGIRIGVDGGVTPARVCYAYRFDAARSSPDGRYTVIYERAGTKGLLLCEGKILRELNRSFYHASAYEYPVELLAGPNGTTLLAHCPESYCRLDLEDAESGRRLTDGGDRKPADFFHSRLAANASGSRILSAGWYWHPWSSVVHFDVGRALEDARHLDELVGAPASKDVCLAEEGAACWQGEDRLVLAGTDEPEDEEAAREQGPNHRLLPRGLAVLDLRNSSIVSSVQLAEPPGTIMAAGTRHVLSFLGHPKLVSLSDGRIVHRWPHLASSDQQTSFTCALSPPLALDPGGDGGRTGPRFALASQDAVTVVEINSAALDS